MSDFDKSFMDESFAPGVGFGLATTLGSILGKLVDKPAAPQQPVVVEKAAPPQPSYTNTSTSTPVNVNITLNLYASPDDEHPMITMRNDGNK